MLLLPLIFIFYKTVFIIFFKTKQQNLVVQLKHGLKAEHHPDVSHLDSRLDTLRLVAEPSVILICWDFCTFSESLQVQTNRSVTPVILSVAMQPLVKARQDQSSGEKTATTRYLDFAT